MTVSSPRDSPSSKNQVQEGCAARPRVFDFACLIALASSSAALAGSLNRRCMWFAMTT
jgi:hypothetical protein